MMTRSRAFVLLPLLTLVGCFTDNEAEERALEGLPREQKIALASQILGDFEPVGYCASMPNLSDVIAEENARVTISLDEPELSYPEANSGTMVGISYICLGHDGRERISEHLVNLRTHEISIHQIDHSGSAPGAIRFRRSQR